MARKADLQGGAAGHSFCGGAAIGRLRSPWYPSDSSCSRTPVLFYQERRAGGTSNPAYQPSTTAGLRADIQVHCDCSINLYPVREPRPRPKSRRNTRKLPHRTSSDSQTTMQLSAVSARPCFAARPLATRPRCGATKSAGSGPTGLQNPASHHRLKSAPPNALSRPWPDTQAARRTLCRRAGAVKTLAVAARDEREEDDGSGVLSGEWAPTW